MRLLFLDDRGEKIGAASVTLSGLHWWRAVPVLGLRCVGGGRAALRAVGQGFSRSWWGQGCAPGPAVAGSLVLSTFLGGLAQLSQVYRLRVTERSGMRALSRATCGLQEWSHLVRAWACTGVAEG